MADLIVALCNFLSVPKTVQFSICVIEHRDVKAYGGVLALGQYHDTPVLLLWRMSLMPLVRRLGGHQSWSGCFGCGICSFQEANPNCVDIVAYSSQQIYGMHMKLL